MMKRKQGFTLVEVSLSLVFIAILSLTVAFIINDTIASYRRGVTLKQINTVGTDLVDDMRASVQNASAKSIRDDCAIVYGNIDKDEGKACDEDGASKFVNVTKKADVVLKNGEELNGIPIYGAFCTGFYSYIWNSGYFFNNEAVNSISVAGPAVLKYGEEGTQGDFRLLKVKDEQRSVCISAANYNKGGDDIIFALEKKPDEDPIDLLASDEANGGLALYDLYASRPAESTAKNNLFYSASFILGTVQGGINIAKSGGFCATPDDYEVENFDYCAINKFNFAVEAAGE